MARQESSDEFARLMNEFERIREDMLRLVDDCGRPAAGRPPAAPGQRAEPPPLSGASQPRPAPIAGTVVCGWTLVARSGRISRPCRGRCRVRSAATRGWPAARRRSCRRSNGSTLASGQRLLDAHTEAVLGPRPVGRGVAIMVTMPSEAADDYTLVDNLLRAGHGLHADQLRARRRPSAWARMIEHLRRAEERRGRPCRVLMDLAGPKFAPAPLEPGPARRQVQARSATHSAG